LFLFSFLFFSSEKRARKAFFILGSFACISFIVRYIAGTFDWYESGKLSLVSSIGENLPHLFQLNSFKQFLHDLTGDYLLWLLIMILNLIVLLREKKYWLIASLFGITISYLLLVYTFNPGGAKFYIQNMTMPLGFMAALPFLFYFISKIKIQFAVAILALIFAIRLVVIYSAHEKFTARISW
jgi:hypothetical protein